MIELRAIQFHGVSGRTVPLRRSEAAGSEFAPPEWVPGRTKPDESPAAYTLVGGPIQVGIRLERPAGGAEQFEIWAEDASADGNLLGHVERQVVSFQSGETAKFVRSAVTGTIPPRIARHDDSLRWKARTVGAADEVELAVTSHRIYTVLGAPGLPWGTDDGDPVLWVWTDVLEMAWCWAKGAGTEKEIADAVTDRLHALGEPGGKGFRYGSAGPSEALAKDHPFAFDCSLFLKKAKQAVAEPNSVHVDCLACSSIVVTLANSLGCALWESTIKAGNTAFVRPIGEAGFGPQQLSRHDIAANGCARKHDDVWDGCFRLVGGSSGTAIAGFPFDIRGRDDYVGRFLLSDGLLLNAFEDVTIRRRVNRAVIEARAPNVPIPLEEVKRLGDDVYKMFMRDDWPQSPLFVHNFFWTSRDLPGLHLFSLPEPSSFHGAQAVWSESGQPDRPVARVAIYEASSRSEARTIFAARLREYTRPVEYLKDVGEVAFHDPERGYKVAIAGNTVWTSMPLTGSAFADEPVFQAVDRWIQPPPSKETMRLGSEQPIPLELPKDPNDPDAPLWYVLEPRNGVLTRDDSVVVFTPSESGPRAVDVTMHHDAEQQNNTTIPL